MTGRKMTFGILVAVGIAATSLFHARMHAERAAMPMFQTGASCYAALDQRQSQIQAFNREFEQNAHNFAVDTVVDTALGDAKGLVQDYATNPPTLARGREMADYKATLEGYDTIMRAYQVTIEDLLRCLAPGSGCNIFDFASKQNAALRRWIESLASERTQTALDRARGAHSLLENAVSQSAGIAAGSASDALNCMNDYVHRAQAAGGDPVDPRDPPSGAPAQQPPIVQSGGGVGVGTLVGVPLAIAGTLVVIDQVQKNLSGCPPEPTITFDACFVPGGSGRSACQAALAQLDAYCQSCKPPQRRGREGQSYECVP